jgi:hypothetical protein
MASFRWPRYTYRATAPWCAFIPGRQGDLVRSASLNERDAFETASFPAIYLTDMTSLHICYWETVGVTGHAAVGSSPVEGAPSERAARRKFHRETITDAGVKLRIYKVVKRR